MKKRRKHRDVVESRLKSRLSAAIKARGMAIRERDAARVNSMSLQHDAIHWRDKYECAQSEVYAAREAFALILKMIPPRKIKAAKALWDKEIKARRSG